MLFKTFYINKNCDFLGRSLKFQIYADVYADLMPSGAQSVYMSDMSLALGIISSKIDQW